MRICDLAKELMTTGKELLGLLQTRGCSVRSTQAKLTPELEQFLRDEIQRIYYTPAEPVQTEETAAEAPAAEVPAAGADVPAVEAPAATATPEAVEAPQAETEAAPAAEGEAAPEEAEEPEPPKTVAIKGHVAVKDYADMLGIKPNVLIAKLMKQGIFASISMKIDFKTAEPIARELGFVLEHEKKATTPPPQPMPEPVQEGVEDTKDDLLPRPPVVTFMGHVDHGKTSLLDYIRKAKVAAGEDGGITQHIGAYQVEHEGRAITFLDTPGHEAFTAMRARGANLTDIAVIVIAAEDGLMPQTKEAIQHAQAAEVAMIIAINKCDLRSANPDRVKRQLQQMGLAPEDWGGELICCQVSATTGDGMDHLLEMILLQSEVLELKANPHRKAQGFVIESRLEAGMGPTANLLVTNGTLQLNDAIVSGASWGRVKAMINDQGKKIRTAGPSSAVKILGMTSVPDPGNDFHIYKNDREARQVADERAAEARIQTLAGDPETKVPLTLDELLQEKSGSDKRTLNIILKTDVLGSLEAIRSSLEGIESDKVDLAIIGTGAGSVTVNDVLLASASKAVILGFHVAKDTGSGAEAKRKGVEIRLYSIIYEMLDEVRALLTGLLEPIIKEHINGNVVIRQIFDMGKRGKVAGGMCQKGKVTLKGRARVRRKDEIIYEGKIATLRRFQNEANDVREGQECGIVLDHFTNFVEGDIIESYEIEKVAQQL